MNPRAKLHKKEGELQEAENWLRNHGHESGDHVLQVRQNRERLQTEIAQLEQELMSAD